MSENEPIRGKIAAILNDTEVAINRGARDGVRIGMVFRILHSQGTEILDPDSDEVIGTLDITKAVVKIRDVQEQVSTAAAFITERVNVGGTGSGLSVSELFNEPKWVTRTKRLEVDGPSLEALSEADDRITVRDPVVHDPHFQDEDSGSTHGSFSLRFGR